MGSTICKSIFCALASRTTVCSSRSIIDVPSCPVRLVPLLMLTTTRCPSAAWLTI